jgi:hypothetical protein
MPVDPESQPLAVAPPNPERGYHRDTIVAAGRAQVRDVVIAVVEIDLRVANLINRWVNIRYTNTTAGAELGFFLVNENDDAPPNPSLAARSGNTQCEAMTEGTTIRRFVAAPFTKLRVIGSAIAGVIRVTEAQLG